MKLKLLYFRKVGGLVGSEDKLLEYKGLIDFSDKMEKDNFKYIDKIVKSKRFSEEEKYSIVCDIIDIHLRYLSYKNKYLKL